MKGFISTSSLVFLCVLLLCIPHSAASRVVTQNPNAISAVSKAAILRRLAFLIQSIHSYSDYYMQIIVADLTGFQVEGHGVNMVISCGNLRDHEPWYNQLMCSIFPDWGIMKPGDTIKYEMMTLLREMQAQAGGFGAMEATSGRYMITYELMDDNKRPNSVSGMNNTSSSPEATDKYVLKAEAAATKMSNRLVRDVAEAGLKNIQMFNNHSKAGVNNHSMRPEDIDGTDCYPYWTCLRSSPSYLEAGRLKSGRSLVALDGSYYLAMQEDCNLVMYRGDMYNPQYSVPIWASKTQYKGQACELHLQMDCNLVIYDLYYTPMWATMKYYPEQRKECALCVQEDGKAVVYDRLAEISLYSTF